MALIENRDTNPDYITTFRHFYLLTRIRIFVLTKGIEFKTPHMKIEIGSAYEKKPTLSQFLKATSPKTKLPLKHKVLLVWYPDTFPSATLETERFRVVIPKPIWVSSGLSDSLLSAIEHEQGIYLTIDRENPKAFEVTLSEGSDTSYISITETGWKVQAEPSKDNPK